MKIDYYEVLGVARDCDDKTIKTAFRKLAMQYHPDKNPGNIEAEQKFKELGEAYEILRDPQKRAAYDRYGHDAFAGGAGGQNPFGDMGGSPFGGFADIFSDMFGDIMGGGMSAQTDPRQRGSDLRYNMTISLAEAYSGLEKQIDIKAATQCDECNGSGAQDGTAPQTCPQCHGAGRERIRQGFFAIERTCSTCHGRGEIVANPCKKCGGAGRVEKHRQINVRIPKGVDTDTRLRLSNEGEAGLFGGPSGDLYIFLTVKEHELFQRENADLYCRVPISMTKAALGGTISVTSLSGKQHEVKIPVGAQNGKKLRLSGEGMPVLQKSGYGDLYILLQIETPQNLNAKQRELLQQFEKLSKSENSPTSSGFFNRMREFFTHL
ncbi:MAG: molecular chaperone DnaJ [Alphaproteobacteria bacterium]|nr:molecular chaperone DnaJ [Alphaproteobacteria bacterium]